MIHSIFTFGKSVVRRIMPFGPLNGDYDFELDDPLVSPDLISVGEFLASFRKVSEGNLADTAIIELENTVRNASIEWFKLLLAHDGLSKLLGSGSPASEQLFCGSFLNNTKFLDAILYNSQTSAVQLAAGVKESPTIRRNVYLLLVSLGMYSYEGYVLIYKTVSLLQRDRPNGMFQYITEEIAAAATESSDSGTREAKLEALIPPLALMVVLFAGGNGFFIESQLRKQIHGSHLLTALANTVQSKFVEEKHNRRLELPTIKEPSPKECTPQIRQAIELLEEAEKSSDKILRWLEEMAEPVVSSKRLTSEPKSDDVEYILQLGDGKKSSTSPSSPAQQLTSLESGYGSTVEIETKREESVADMRTGPVQPRLILDGHQKPEDDLSKKAIQSPPSVISFEQFAQGAAVPDVIPTGVPVNSSPTLPSTPLCPSDQTFVEVPEDVTKVSSISDLTVSSTVTPALSQPSPQSNGTRTAPPPPPAPPLPKVDGNGFFTSSRIPRSNLRPLRWTKLDTSADVVSQSVWEPAPNVPKIDMDKLGTIFKVEKSKQKLSSSRDSVADTDVNPTSLISPQTELRINVILKQFPDISGEDLAKRILQCDISEFDESQLKELIAALPSDLEFEEIEKRKGQFAPSKPAEHFLLGLLEVDNVKLRLEVMLFVIDFPVTERSVRRNCEDIMKACTIIQTSQPFRSFLQLVLRVGNKMNEGRAIGDAAAFDTSILVKLADVPSSQPKVSLLHFLVDQLRESDPNALKFLDELEPALEMARIPLIQMKNEVLVARETYAQLLEEMQEVPEPVQKQLQRLLQGLRARLNSLTNIVVEAQQRAQTLAMYLVEDPGMFQINDYIEMLGSFLHSVRNILEMQNRHDSVSSHTSEPASSALHSAPIFKDPNTASVFQSLRNELQTKLSVEHDDV